MVRLPARVRVKSFVPYPLHIGAPTDVYILRSICQTIRAEQQKAQGRTECPMFAYRLMGTYRKRSHLASAARCFARSFFSWRAQPTDPQLVFFAVPRQSGEQTRGRTQQRTKRRAQVCPRHTICLYQPVVLFARFGRVAAAFRSLAQEEATCPTKRSGVVCNSVSELVCPRARELPVLPTQK